MNNHGIIRQLKRIDKETNKNSEKFSNGNNYISFLALIVSCIALYFQFFYYHYNLNTTFVSGGVENDSLHVELVFHNQGNQDATIIESRLWFYTDSNLNNPKSHIGFVNKKKDPFILSNGQQKFFQIKNSCDFSNFEFDERNINPSDTLRIELQLKYLNSSNLITEKEKIIGWLTLDKIKKIEYYSLNFKKIEMDTDSHISRTYRVKKQ